MIGLERRTVVLIRHDPAWEAEAARAITALRGAFGDATVAVEHVGSTAVPGIVAKPIIDIAVAASSLDDVRSHDDAMLACGFHFRPDTHTPNQLLYAKGSYYEGDGNLQTHFVHVVPAGSRAWHDYLGFRDALRVDPALAHKYETLKLSLAAQASAQGSRAYYTAGKQAFIERALSSIMEIVR